MTAADVLDSSERPPRRHSGGWFILLLAVLAGLGFRVLMLLKTEGTNDAYTWAQFGHYINQWGLYVQYQVNEYLNHPPLPVYWAVVAYRTAVPSLYWWDDKPALRPWFSTVFRVPAVLADGLSCWILYRTLKQRLGPTRAMAVAAAFAWSPCAMLVAGYHTNTDSVMAMLILLSASLASGGKRPFLAGLALAAAINIKLTPLILVPVLLLLCRRWRDLAWTVLGLSLGVLPFVPLMVVSWAKFRTQAIGYRSNPESWGILYLLMEATGGPTYGKGDLSVGPSRVVQFYYENGRWLVVACVLGWAVVARRLWLLRRLDACDVMAVAVALFLILAPGFGIQYIVTVLPVMFASRAKWATVYGLAAGAFALLMYAGHWTGTWPAYSEFSGRLRPPVPYVGLLAWALLIGYVVVVVREGFRGGRRQVEGDDADRSSGSMGFRTFG